MNQVLNIIQLFLGIALIGLILIQSSKGGLGQAFGGSEFHTKRGAEKIVFRLTVAACFIFLLISIANIIIR